MIQETLKIETPKQSKERINIPATPYNIFPKIKTLQINDFFENKKSKNVGTAGMSGNEYKQSKSKIDKGFS